MRVVILVVMGAGATAEKLLLTAGIPCGSWGVSMHALHSFLRAAKLYKGGARYPAFRQLPKSRGVAIPWRMGGRLECHRVCTIACIALPLLVTGGEGCPGAGPGVFTCML